MHMYLCEHTNICRLKPEAVVLVVHQAIRSEHSMAALQEERGVEARHNVLYRAQEEKEFFFTKDKKGFQGYGQNDC